MTLTVHCATTLPELDASAAAWNDLALKSPQRLPMLSHAWMSSWLEHCLPKGASWACYLAYDRSQLVGVLPLVSPKRSWPPLGRQLLTTPFDWHTFSVDAVVSSGREHEVLSALLAAARKKAKGPSTICFRYIPEHSPTPSALAAADPRTPLVFVFRGLGRYLPVQGTFGTYHSSLSSKLRASLRNGNNKLSRLGQEETRFVERPTEHDRFFDRFIALESSGWKGQSGTAIGSADRLHAFYRSLTRKLALLGWLEWHLLFLSGELVAAQMAMRFNETIVALKIAYDERVAVCSPGQLLTERVLRRAFASGVVREVNFLSDASWLSGWRLATRPYHDIFVYEPGLSGTILGAAPHRGWLAVKKQPIIRTMWTLLSPSAGRQTSWLRRIPHT